MNVIDTINKYCQENSDEFDTIPDHFNCSEIISYDTGEFNGIEITAFWNIIELDPYGYSDILDEEPEEQEISKKEKFKLDESEKLYDLIYNKITKLRSNINLSQGRIKSVSFNKHFKMKQNDFVNSPFYTIDDSTYSSIALIDVIRDKSSDVNEKIRQYVKQELQKIDPDITNDEIVQIECPYHDFAICESLGIRGYVVTPNPYRYYSDVESVEEYVQVISDSDEEYNKLIEQDKYHIYYRLDETGEEVPEEMKNIVESVMKEQMNSIANIKGEYMFEAESILIRDYTQYPEYDTEENNFTIYDMEDNKESIMFYVRQPFDSI